ncbi:c-type cytochrome [Acidicapsa ligni]|uniref:c-type cytochrome n=1 Tax=Acidicapsa ligni TaxID=542300 RepID=UPI0021E0E9A3|nr:c-type cytochrome [Acidicapsa ligni]
MKTMNRKFKVAFPAPVAFVMMCAFLCGLCLSSEALAETLPDGQGKAEFVHNCTACHRADMVTRVKKTPDAWKKNVFEMASRGTDGTKEDLDNVVLYLDKYYATDKPASDSATQATTPDSTAASTPGGPAVPDSPELEHVKQVIADNGCLTCHRIEKHGAYTGPSLNGLGTRRTASEIRKSIVTPPPTVDASNNLVRLTTADGKTVTGRILSQDDQQVRIMDASGEAATYSKQGLSQFTIINTNPMPSYERRITGDDLDALIRYLSSLPPVGESVSK